MHIELLQMPRASGKTTLLIKESAKTGKPIIEPNTASARYVEEQARAMGLKIPEPISATSWNGGYYRGSNFNRIDGFLIDEVDSVLANIFGRPICKVTYTPEKIDVPYLKMNGLKSTKLKNVLKVELLPYHTMAIDKYKKLNIDYKLNGTPDMDVTRCKELENKLNNLIKEGIK